LLGGGGGGGGRILSPLCRLEAHFTDCRRPEDEEDHLIQFSTKAENAYRVELQDVMLTNTLTNKTTHQHRVAKSHSARNHAGKNTQAATAKMNLFLLTL